jgi:hypothetical protein
VLSLLLRTKDNVVPAGHSPPLVLWKVLISLRLVNLSHFLNSNSLIVQLKTMGAMVDQCSLLSNILKTILLRLSLNTLMLLTLKDVHTKRTKE